MARKTQRPDFEKEIAELNFSIFKDCVARRLLISLSDSDQCDPDDLEEFSIYLAQESWPALPVSIKEISYKTDTVPEADEVLLNIPPSVSETLAAYNIISSDPDQAYTFLRRVLESFIPLATEPPPIWSNTRTSECEICQRTVPLTYHHLIPRSTHDRVLKRGWHPPEMLNSVAWLCRPCHSTVHSVASNEELAKEYYTLKRLLERPDIQRWAKYASKQRWGVRRG